MADRNLTLGIQTDEKAVQNAKRRLTEIQSSLKSLDKGFKSGKISTQQYTQEVTRLSKEQLALSSSLDKGTSGAAKAEKELIKLETAQRKLVVAFRDGKISAEQFNSSLSRIQGRAGVQQQALGAALPSEGGGRSGRGLLGEVGLAVRNAPAIPIPGTGITSEPIAKAAIALDRLGVSASTLGTAALVAAPIIIALAVATKDWAKQAQELTTVVETQRQVAQQIAGGLTTTDANERLAELNRLRDDEAKRLENLRQAQQEVVNSLKGMTVEEIALLSAAGGLSPQMAALNEQVTESERLVNSYSTEQDLLNRALENGKLASNDAAEAEKQLAEERSKATLAQAAAAADLVRAQKEVEELTRAEAGERQDALEDQAAALRAQLAVLKSSGDTSEAVTSQIADLETQLKSLGDQAKVFRDVAQSSKPTVKELAELEEERLKKAEKDAKDAAREEERLGKKMQSAREKERSEREKQAEQLADLEKKFQRDEAKLRQNLIDKRLDEATNFARDIEDITREGRRDRRRSLAEGDFLGLDEINDREREAKEDAILENRRANMDITRDAQRAHRDLVTAADQQRRDIMAVTQSMHRQTLGMTANWASNMTSILQNFFSANLRFTQSRARMFSNAPATPG